MNYIEKIKSPIFAEMQELEKVFTKVLDSDNELLSGVHGYIMEGSGKKLRPILTLLAAKLLGQINDETLYGAFSLELLHTASLVHDDVVDDTLERRGRASVNARWTNKIAVLTGDYILSKSLYCANATGNLAIMKTISVIGMTLPDGELLQLANTKQSATTEHEYFEIIKRKTALLFATCTEVGGLSVKATKDELQHLRNFGEFLGICFQIKDDIFDYYEDVHIGKPTGNDVRDGKLTLPLIYALKNTSEKEKEEVVKLIDSKDFTTENINKIMHFAHGYGGVDYAKKMMDQFMEKAVNELKDFPENEAKKALLDCVEFVAARDF
ncbi:MAG: polyprenyl synthetase family protein [Paludibacteraceae bacterium]